MAEINHLKDINLWDLIPVLHCLAYAGSNKNFSLKGVPDNFMKGLDTLDTLFHAQEEWVSDEVQEVAGYVMASDVDSIMAIEGRKGTMIRYAYLCAVVVPNIRTLRQVYMRGRDERFKAHSSDKEYESFLREEYTELAVCVIGLGKSRKYTLPLLGYLLKHYPLPINDTLGA